MAPVLFRRGQYLHSLLLQKGNPLFVDGFRVCWAKFVVCAPPLRVVELVRLMLASTFVVGLKKSVMELCLDVPAIGSGSIAGGEGGPVIVTKSGSAPA